MTIAKIRQLVSVPGTSARRRLRKRDWPHPPRRDPHTRVIAQLLELAGPDSSVIATSSVPWASATFVGARHRIVMRISGADHAARADILVENLPDAEFSISGHIVADACIDERQLHLVRAEGETASPEESATETMLRLTILTIEDW
jgi:hypothetical protein